MNGFGLKKDMDKHAFTRTNHMQIQARSHSNLGTIFRSDSERSKWIRQRLPVISSVFDAASFVLIKTHAGTDRNRTFTPNLQQAAMQE